MQTKYTTPSITAWNWIWIVLVHGEAERMNNGRIFLVSQLTGFCFFTENGWFNPIGFTVCVKPPDYFFW